ncbi:MAG: D-alanyl-D-alanine carboxypeptidase [Clostridia bacterium]|nr:D-alanyl-D-alanine carboxypeptidase [Clostridia bacterium]
MKRKTKIKSLFLAVTTLLFSALVFAPASHAVPAPPAIEKAKAAYVSCIETGEVLFSYNPEAELYTTSSTKLMTAIVAIEALSSRLDERVTITSQMLSEVAGNRLGLKANEVVSVRDLIYALITGCDNDGAYCLAYLAYGSVAAFVEQMNAKAAVIGAHNTHYTNPTGLHDEKMKTTITDTALIAKYAWNLPLFAEASSTQKYVMEPTNLEETRNIYNRNCLISKYYSANYYNGHCGGLNAGSTSQGGHCVITVAKNEDLSYLVIVMGAETSEEMIYSYYNVNKLIDWAFSSFAMADVLTESRVICEMPVELASAVDFVTIAPEKSVSVFLPTDVDIEKEIEYSWSTTEETLRAPLKAGDVVGQISATYKAPGDEDARILGSCNLVVTSDVDRSDFLYALNRIENFTKSRGFIAAVIFAVLATVAVILFNARRRKTRGPY